MRVHESLVSVDGVEPRDLGIDVGSPRVIVRVQSVSHSMPDLSP